MKTSEFRSPLPGNEKVLFSVALVLKIFAGLCMSFLYLNYFDGGDSKLYFTEAQEIERYSSENEIGFFQILFGSRSSEGLYDQSIFKNQPSALFFNKIVYVFYLLAGGNYWLISVYLSLTSFFGFWIFYKTLSHSFSLSGMPLVTALFLWPSVVFWSSGLIKESVSVFLILIIVSSLLKLIKINKWWPFYIFVFIICTYFLFKIKYYYAAILVPSLLSYYLCESGKKISGLFKEKISLQLISFLSVFCLLVWAASSLHYNLKLENVADVIVKNYHLFEVKSEPGKMINFNNLSPSFWSLFMNSPKALFSGLFRPNILDIQNVWSALSGVENFVLLILAVFQLKNIRKIKKEYALVVFTAIAFCSLMAVLLSFSAPNFGTLVRYKVGFLPIFLIVLLTANPLIQHIKIPKVKSRIFK